MDPCGVRITIVFTLLERCVDMLNSAGPFLFFVKNVSLLHGMFKIRIDALVLQIPHFGRMQSGLAGVFSVSKLHANMQGGGSVVPMRTNIAKGSVRYATAF